jgi:hypothetical protein
MAVAPFNPHLQLLEILSIHTNTTNYPLGYFAVSEADTRTRNTVVTFIRF